MPEFTNPAANYPVGTHKGPKKHQSHLTEETERPKCKWEWNIPSFCWGKWLDQLVPSCERARSTRTPPLQGSSLSAKRDLLQATKMVTQNMLVFSQIMGSKDRRQCLRHSINPLHQGELRASAATEHPSAVYLGSGEQHHTSQERHQGDAKVPDHEPGCSIQHQEVKENQEEEEVIGPQKSHLLNGAAQLTEILQEGFLWVKWILMHYLLWKCHRAEPGIPKQPQKLEMFCQWGLSAKTSMKWTDFTLILRHPIEENWAGFGALVLIPCSQGWI